MVKTGKQVALIYKHRQKSWDTFAFVGLFQLKHNQPLPHPTNNAGHVYQECFLSFNIVLGGGRENCKKNSKRMHCLMRAARNYGRFWILHYCPKIDVVIWFKILWTPLLLRDKQFSWNYVGHRRYLATIPNHQRNLWRIRNHLKKVKENNSKKIKYFLTIKILWHRSWCLDELH